MAMQRDEPSDDIFEIDAQLNEMQHQPKSKILDTGHILNTASVANLNENEIEAQASRN